MFGAYIHRHLESVSAQVERYLSDVVSSAKASARILSCLEQSWMFLKVHPEHSKVQQDQASPVHLGSLLHSHIIRKFGQLKFSFLYNPKPTYVLTILRSKLLGRLLLGIASDRAMLIGSLFT